MFNLILYLKRREKLLKVQKKLKQLTDPANGLGVARGDFPRINIYKIEDHARVEAALPGINPENVRVEAKGNELKIKSAFVPDEGKTGRCIRAERKAGKIYRLVELPYTIDSEKMTVGFANGIMTVDLPKSLVETP